MIGVYGKNLGLNDLRIERRIPVNEQSTCNIQHTTPSIYNIVGDGPVMD